jgi:hypothetical protein
MNQSGATHISYAFNLLSKEWSLAGRKLGQPGTQACVMEGCGSMAFVGLRTGTGPKPVCFRHYTQLDESPDIAE